jgi:hypothetical protein
MGSLPGENITGVSITIQTFLKALLGIALALVVIYSSVMLLRGVSLKTVLGSSLAIAGISLVMLCILFVLVNVRVTIGPRQVETLPPMPTLVAGEPAPLPASLIGLVWIILAALAMLSAAWLVRWRKEQALTSDPLKREAEHALRALLMGADLKDVIIRCYQQMSLVLQKEQGIELEETMTAREFERLLAARGVPQLPVCQLTRLFESARYGWRQPSPDEKQAALDCLKAIQQYSHAAREAS